MDHVLIVDDEASVRTPLRFAFERAGFEVSEAESLPAADRAVREGAPDLVLLDLKLHGQSSLPSIPEYAKGRPVIMMTGYASVDVAVDALKRGACDFIEKPFSLKKVVEAARRALRCERTIFEPGGGSDVEVVGASKALAAVFARVRKVARTPATTVLIEGESGVGKELVARRIHAESDRASKRFVAVNCAAIQESLLEAELFGYERGAFTGAAAEGRPGLFEIANGGTLFLDEVSEMGTGLQAKLLRILEERRYRRVGGREELEADVRIVAATNRDLASEVDRGRFRRDLYYRLRVFPVHVPPLRSRPEDVLPLATFFLEQRARLFGKSLTGFSDAARRRLLDHPWPGNVRELRNAIEYAAVVAEGLQVGVDDLLLERGPASGVGALGAQTAPVAVPAGAGAAPAAPRAEPSTGASTEDGYAVLRLSDRRLASAERELIQLVLKECGGKKTRAAKLLGINRTTLYNKLREYEIAVG